VSNTPMTDLYLGRFPLIFASQYGSEVYHGYAFQPGTCRYPSRCKRLHPQWPITGAVTAFKEPDISGVRRPCQRCLAALRRAQKEAPA